MRQSDLFIKTRKQPPKDEVSTNAALLIRGGFIDKLNAGIYSFLPLGLQILKNIEQIVREEMNAIGGQEILMPSLHPKENWMKTGRWETFDILYKVTDASGREFALGPTHEEVIVPLARQFISSYKDLPVALYQIQNKFRMELRPKAGLLRGREFLMKDLYSFHANEEDFMEYYERAKEAYKKIFERVGIGDRTFLTFASGGTFSQYSHEFQTVTPAGEDTIYLCTACNVAINEEIVGEQPTCPQCAGHDLQQKKSIEVGNIFPLKTKFSDVFDLRYRNTHGEEIPVIMGCYGIGIGRLMGTVVETLHDDNGIIWPQSIAPFMVHLLELDKEGGAIYEELKRAGITVLYDDRDVPAGEKLADADLLGMPYRVITSKKAGNKVEVKERNALEPQHISLEEFIAQIGNKS